MEGSKMELYGPLPVAKFFSCAFVLRNNQTDLGILLNLELAICLF